MKSVVATAVAFIALVFAAAAPVAHAAYGDNFGITPSLGTAFPEESAFWAGTCDLRSTGHVGSGTPPPAPADCIDKGTANPTGSSDQVWTPTGQPNWRLDPVTQAGAHPDGTTSLWLSRISINGNMPLPDGNIKDIVVDLPPGLSGNPTAVTKCPGELFRSVPPQCPPSSQVGVVTTTTNNIGFSIVTMLQPVYNLAPRRGKTAEFGIYPTGLTWFRLVARARTGSDFGVSVSASDIPTGLPLMGNTLTFWGVPWDASHDLYRPTSGTLQIPPAGLAPAAQQHYDPSWGDEIEPFLSNPTECSADPLKTHFIADAWQNIGQTKSDGTPDLSDSSWVDVPSTAPLVTGCGDVPFDGSLSATPDSSQPSAPAGYGFDLSIPQTSDPDVLATGHLKKAVVTLPEGVVVNPSAADGLGGCSLGEANFDSEGDVDCPDSSKIGSLSVETPLLEDPLAGDVYLAKPYDNEFDSLLSLILVARGPGIVVKIPGRVDPDPVTGRLKATFDDNPQVPFSDLHLQFKSGPKAPITNPATCGSKTVETELTAWSGKVVESESSFGIDCPGNADQFDPGFSAGTTSPNARSFAPFVTRVTRSVGKELGRIDVTLPKGALASLKGVEKCGDAQVASAAGRSGVATQAASACPAGSQVGTTTVGAGAGSDPFFPRLPGSNVSGRVFLTGKHTNTDSPVPGGRQADYGLAIEVPAVGGPFDLGTVMVRAAIYVDPATAQVRVVSDKLPRILEGIPLDVRDIRVNIDRPGFTLNPSSCDQEQVAGDIAAQDGTSVSRTVPFRAEGCSALPFKPSIALQAIGRNQVKTGTHPRIKATVRQAGVGEAGIEKAVVRLPKSLALDPENAQALCEFEDGTKPDLENRCPAGSIVGRARATTPLLNNELVGNVYFVKNVRKDPTTGNLIRTLPMIIVALRGEVAINLRGESSTTGAGKLVNTFASVPDAPISQFNLNIAGGKNGILAVTRTRKAKINLCASRQIAEVDTDGHNGRQHDFDARIKTPCTKAQTKAAKRKAKRAAAKK